MGIPHIMKKLIEYFKSLDGTQWTLIGITVFAVIVNAIRVYVW